MNHRRFFSILLVYHSTAQLSRKIEKTLPCLFIFFVIKISKYFMKEEAQ
jgi:hypothetical protein